jgi:excisionase family DNA binding protein
MLTVSEAATELGVSAKTVRRWIKSKRLRALRFSPRALRVREHDLSVFCKKSETVKTTLQ